MRYLPLQEDATTAILIKDTLLKSKDLNHEYADLVQSSCCAVSLEYGQKKPTAQFRKDYLKKLLPFTPPSFFPLLSLSDNFMRPSQTVIPFPYLGNFLLMHA